MVISCRSTAPAAARDGLANRSALRPLPKWRTVLRAEPISAWPCTMGNEEAVSMRRLLPGFLRALGAELAHGRAEMLRADDKGVEGCRTPGLRRQKVADRGQACLAA